MKVYRLSKSRFAGDLSGTGAEINGGRWNSKGTPLLYTCETPELCLAEVLVHLVDAETPGEYALVTIDIRGTPSVLQMLSTDLPSNWKSQPPKLATQLIGDDFVAKEHHLILKVPSVIVSQSNLLLINPRHKSFGSVKVEKIEPFEIDRRLLKIKKLK